MSEARSKPGWRRPATWVRAAVMGFAAFAATAQVAHASATLAAVVGAIVGVFVGQGLGASRLRFWPLLVILSLAALAGWQGATWVTDGALMPGLLGARGALVAGAVAKLGVVAFCAAAVLRTAAVRQPAAGVLELVAASGALAMLLAAHRDGVVARPMWLADWAGQQGVDPKLALMSVGAAAVLALAVAAILETGRRVSLASMLPLSIFLGLMVSVIDADQLPEAQAANNLGLTDPNIGDPPKPSDIEGQDQPGPGGARGEGQQQNQGQGQGQNGQSGDPLDEALRGGDPNQGKEGQGGGGGQRPEGQGQGQGQGGQPQQGQGQGQGQSGDPQQQGQGQGQSNQAPDLNDQQNPGSSPAPMAVVLLGDDYTPPTQAYYFRQQVWSEFNGGRLVESRRGDVDRDLIRAFPSRQVEAAEPPPEAHHKRVRATVALVVRHVGPFALDAGVRMRPAPNPKPGRFWRAYEFESLAPTWEPEDLVGRLAGEDDWDQARWDHYLAGPDDPRYGELARSLVERLPEDKRSDPFLQALAVKLWMDEQLTYSTSERHAGVADPTADFLFGNRVGYCVHFAHAAVYMWRSLGIPARVGAGYHVSMDEARGSTILIRGGDAHAWPELYLEGIGWVVLDISARQNLDPPGQPMDDDLLDKLGELARDIPEPGEMEDERDAEPNADRRDFRREIALFTSALLLLLFLGGWGTKLWRRASPRWAAAGALPRVAYRRALDRLTEHGIRRRYGESREAFARRLAATTPAFTEMTAMHVAAHLRNPASQAKDAGARARWKELDRSLRAQLRGAAPWWRRALGWLNPLSFLGAR